MHIDQLNIHNLISLWKKYGETSVIETPTSKLLASKSWPYRCWVEGEPNLLLQLSQTPNTHRLSSWPYSLTESEGKSLPDSLNEHWQLEFIQTAMYLPLNKLTLPIEQMPDLSLNLVEDFDSLNIWLQISSEAFGYDMNIEVFKPLLADPEIEIYLGNINQQPAISALLYKTGEVTGLHQMGVKKDFQGQGLAKKVMNKLLTTAMQQGSEYMVLQASEVGLPLYLTLGFQKQFRLLNFRFREKKQFVEPPR